VLKHLAEVAHVDPAIAVGTLDKMLGFVVRLFANTRSDDLASSDGHAPDIGRDEKRR
jgi:hypothetical protein